MSRWSKAYPRGASVVQVRSSPQGKSVGAYHKGSRLNRLEPPLKVGNGFALFPYLSIKGESEMPTIRVQVRGKVATNLTPEEKLVCWNEDYEVEFDFDESWAGVNFKTGLFIRNGELMAQPFDGNICAVPRIENTTLLAVGVKSSDGRLFTTTPAFVDCLKSASDLATNKIPAPTKDVYDEIIALINKYIGQGGGGSGGSVDFRDYQKKVDDGLETQSKEIVGAINEVKGLAETAKMVFGETEGTAYEGNKGKANADNIAKLQNELSIVNISLEQSGLLKKYKQPIEQEYNERVTADGTNVLDGSKAVLKKVVGNTVAYKNLVDIPFVDANSYTTIQVNFTQNIFITAGVLATVSQSVWRFRFGYADGSSMYAQDEELAQGGKKITATAVNPIVEVEYRGSLITAGQYSKIMIAYGDTATPWQPIFTGLKSASFGGIESTNADGTETSTLDFPKTETPLGVTIDFENKKITDYGVDIVLKGTEIWSYYSGNVNGVKSNGVICYDLLPYVDDKNENGVCTDADIGVFGQYGIVLGLNSTNVYWNGILDSLGYTTAGVEPTTEERNTAISKFTAYLAQRYADGNPVTIRYVSSALQSESTFTEGNEYTAYKGGTERVLYNDGNEYGADNTLTQDYILVTEV